VAGEILASSGDGVGRGSCGEGLGLARDRLEPELGVEVAGGGARGGAMRRHQQGPSSGVGCGEGCS
jgi:hypothetical protein